MEPKDFLVFRSVARIEGDGAAATARLTGGGEVHEDGGNGNNAYV